MACLCFYYTVFCPLSHVVLYSVRSSGYQLEMLGCTVAAVSAQRLVEHVKNALQNIATEGTKHRVFLACHSAALPGYRSTRLPSVCCSAVRNKSLICTLGTDQSACACGSMFVVRASGYFIKLPAHHPSTTACKEEQCCDTFNS